MSRVGFKDVGNQDEKDDEFIDTFKLNLEDEDVQVDVMDAPKPKRKFSFKRAMSMRRSMISGELEDSAVKFTRRTSQIVTELEKLDKDGDGNINALDIARYVDKKLQTKAKLKYWKWAALAAFTLFVVTLGVNMGLTYAVVEIAKDTKYSDNKMTLKESGDTVLTGKATEELSFNDGETMNKLLALLDSNPRMLDNLNHFAYEEEGVSKGFQVTGYERSKDAYNLTSVTLLGSNSTYTIRPVLPQEDASSRRSLQISIPKISIPKVTISFDSKSFTQALLASMASVKEDDSLTWEEKKMRVRKRGWRRSML